MGRTRESISSRSGDFLWGYFPLATNFTNFHWGRRGSSKLEALSWDGITDLFGRPEQLEQKMRIKGGGTTEHFSGGLSNVVVRVLPSRE